jgi:hypothetical protein
MLHGMYRVARNGHLPRAISWSMVRGPMIAEVTAGWRVAKYRLNLQQPSGSTRQNHEQILNPARAAFANPDADVSMTRDLPTRWRRIGHPVPQFLPIAASYYWRTMLGEIDAVCEVAATLAGDNPEAILLAWLHRFYAYFTSKRLVAAELLEHTNRDHPVFDAGIARVRNAGRPLLRAAQATNQIGPISPSSRSPT